MDAAELVSFVTDIVFLHELETAEKLTVIDRCAEIAAVENRLHLANFEDEDIVIVNSIDITSTLSAQVNSTVPVCNQINIPALYKLKGKIVKDRSHLRMARIVQILDTVINS